MLERPAPPTPRPVVRIFSEVRLQRDIGGFIEALDHSSGASAWDVYVEQLGAVDLAARVAPTDGTFGVPLGRIAVHPLPFYSGARQLVRRLPRVISAVLKATSGPSVCLFRLPGTLGLIGGAWCRMCGRPYAVEVVGEPQEVLRSGVLGPVGQMLALAVGLLMRWVVKGSAAGRYVTNSTLQKVYPLALGVPEHRYSNVRLADEDFTTTPRSQSEPVRRLLAVGTQDQLYKGHDDLIHAVALLRKQGLDVELGLVGDGRYHQWLVALAARVGVADVVTFHGRVNARADLRLLLDECDLFCMPSRTEGLPRALIEAMARGVPAIGTDVGGIPELLEPRFCIPPNNPSALAALIQKFADGTIDAERASAVVWSKAQRFRHQQQAERIRLWLAEVAELAGSRA